jgi:hypothetical protein
MNQKVKLVYCTPKPVFGGVKIGSLFKHLNLPELPEPETLIVPLSKLETTLTKDQWLFKDGKPFIPEYKIEGIQNGPMSGYGANLTKMGKDKDGNVGKGNGLEHFEHSVQLGKKPDGTWFIDHDFIHKHEGAGCQNGIGTAANITVPVLLMSALNRPREFWLMFNIAYRAGILDRSALPKVKYGMYTLDFPGGFGDLADANAQKKNAQIELLEEMGLKIDEGRIFQTGYGVANRSDCGNGAFTHMTLVDVSEVSEPNQADPGDLIDPTTRVLIPLKLCFPYVDRTVNNAIFDTMYSLSALQQMPKESRDKIWQGA